jgi:GT2 family glycosyltransferase
LLRKVQDSYARQGPTHSTRYWDWAAFQPDKGQTLLPYDASHPFVFATGGHAIYRRRVFEKVRWDEGLRHGDNEEFRFAAQARAAGFKYALCVQAQVFLQYPHCDALAAVTNSTPKPAGPPCAEFANALAAAQATAAPAEPQSRLPAADGFLARVRHKLPGKLPGKLSASLPPETGEIDVSILVACNRYLQRFRVFARSICLQDYELGRVEVVVGNPHSPDGLSDYLAALRRAAESGNGGPHFREVLADPSHFRNRGFLVQRALEASRGSVVIGMDCDLVLPKHFLKMVVQMVRSNPNRVVGVYRRFLTPKTTDSILTGLVDPLTASEALGEEDEEEENGFRGVLGYCQAALREPWLKVGYPEEFDNIAKSDVAFIDRLARVGVRPHFLRGLCVLHLHHPRNWEGTQAFL